MEDIEKTKTKKSRFSFKTKIILFELAIIGVMALVGWYFWNQIQTAKQYISEHNTLQNEIERCQGLISQSSGNFEDYEYCKTLLLKFKN